jgi:hypothetical protein
MPNCVLCSEAFDIEDRMFEQRLIEDSDFCPKCFGEILDEDDEYVPYNLYESTIR